MLPYPSGTLHMGHILVYTIGDVLTHFRRRNGMHVLRPMGYDSFGLPAENAAIREGGRPREIVEKNIAHIRWEFKRLGYAMDWSREFSTHEPEYYRWTQWLFLKLYEAGLAYRKRHRSSGARRTRSCWRTSRSGGTLRVLRRRGRGANDGAVVLPDDGLRRRAARFDGREIDWPERILAMQRHWIGRSHGAEIVFRIDELDTDVPVFTTRADTLFGATFFVIAPEHPLVEQLAERSPRGTRSAPTRRSPRRSEARSGRRRSRRPASTRASTRRIPSTASACRSGSPTTC